MPIISQEHTEDAGFGMVYSCIMIDDGWALARLRLMLIRRAVNGLTLQSHAV